MIDEHKFPMRLRAAMDRAAIVLQNAAHGRNREVDDDTQRLVRDVLDELDRACTESGLAARRASPKESEGQRQSGLLGALKTPETRMDAGVEGGHLAGAEGLELPPLPKPPRHVTKHPQIGEMYDRIGLHAFAIKYASEAVEADRRAREVAHISEMAQWARDNGLNVPVEWSGRAQQPAPAASIGDDAKLAEARRVPDGYVLLPKVPTKDMLRAGMPMFLERREPATAAWQTWNRMIAAAPAPGKEDA